MLARTAITILAREKGKYVGVVIGVAMSLLLVLLQFGFFLGFQRDITIVGDSFDADLWVTQRSLEAFDYVSHFDDLPRMQMLGDEDVLTATGIIADWARFRRMTDGATESGFLVGIEFTDGVKLDLGTDPSLDLASVLGVPGNVLVDEKHLDRIAPKATKGVGLEVFGLHANVAGTMKGKKLFSTACLLVTDMENARRFLKSPANRVSFIAVKCRPGADVAAVQARLQAGLPEQRVWTSREFHDLTQNYWIRLTGIGPVLLLSAGLAALVGFLTVFLAFSQLTAEKMPVYAAMKAMGASTAELSGIALLQIGVVFGLGCLIALSALMVSLAVLAHTTISIVLTPGIALLGVLFMASCSVAAGMRALLRLAKLEPAEAFRA